MELNNLIERRLDLPRLAKDLDEIGTPARVWATRQWTQPIQAKLYEAARGFRPITLDDYVPPATPAHVEVITHGTSVLPLNNHFQMRFCKPADPDTNDQLFGYNEHSLSAFTGPGYYVAHRAVDEGEVDIDYTMMAKEKADAWPPIVASSTRLGRFVFDGTVDVMRGISSHVSIGRARNKRGWMDVWFVLVRQDPQLST